MNKLVLFEGIPGSGKTTTSKLYYELLLNKGYKVKHFSEGDLHPADLSWQSVLSVEEYNNLLSNYSEFKDAICSNTVIEDEYAITAYTKLNLSRESELYKYLDSHEVYNMSDDLSTFKSVHLSRWKKFIKTIDQNTIYIFECVLLQNHITQLMLEYEATEVEIMEYFDDFIEVIKSMNPIVHYLNPVDVDKAILHVAKIRRPEYQQRNNVWIDRVLEYVKTSPYGRTNKIVDLDGYIEFTRKRQELEKRIMKTWAIDVNIIEHDGMSWNEVISIIDSSTID
jgi:adenylate kinase family enzyme